MKLRILALALSLSLSGCAARVAHVTNLPAGVTEQQAKNYDAAVADLHKIALTTTTLRQAVIALRGGGPNHESVIDDKAFGAALQAIAKIDEGQLAASSYLRDAPQYFGDPQKQRIKEIFASITAEIETLNTQGVTGIKNPDSANRINSLIAELAGVVNLVLSLT